MKILVITNLYPPHEIGGYELRCRDACLALEASGHEVHILTSDHQVPGRICPPQPKVSRSLKIHGMYGHPWLPIHRLHALERHNHQILRQQIASIQPDLVHVWNMGGISKSLLLPLEQSGRPVVYDISDHWIARSLRADVWLDWWNAAGSPARVIGRNILKFLGIRRLLDRSTPTAPCENLQFKHIYFCSAFMRDHTASHGWPVSHGSVIHCGIATGAFSIRHEYSRFEKLLWVGRLSADKDPLTAIRALAAAHRAGLTHLTLDLYGHGEPAAIAQVDEEIVALGLSGHVQRKLAPAAEMCHLYARYDALLFTSHWGEPFALTPLEAMASAIPVITSLDGGQVELARHGTNCLVAAAADPELYALRIAELAASPELRHRLATTALEEVRSRFDIVPITRQIEAFLVSALAS
jgi:glycosyltransferase involved in cell wall biosynthesis